MTHREFELEVMAFFELDAILSSKKKPGPSGDFLEKAKEFLKKGQPVTPEELGWNNAES